MKLKRATVEDVDTYIATEKSLGEIKLYSTTTDRDEAIKELEENIIYFIMEGDQVLGHIGYELKSENNAYLSNFVIRPEYQGRGLARQAMEKILAELKSIKLIDLVVHPDNAKAIKVYESFGFKQTGERYENYFGDGEPRIRLVLQ